MTKGAILTWVLGASTVLGGVGALWYFWDKFTSWLFGKRRVPQGVTIEDAKSYQGSIQAQDETGSGARIRKAEAEKDIIARSSPVEHLSPKV